VPRVINPPSLPDPSVYSYSHAILEDDGRLHVSGQVGLDGEGALAAEDVESQARQAFDNIAAILEASGGDIGDVRKVTAYVVDPQSRYGDYHEVWLDTFYEPYPCHTVVGVDQLAADQYVIEIEVGATVDA